MKKVKISNKSIMPFDCWCSVVHFVGLNGMKNLFLLPVKGLEEYINKVYPGACRNIEFHMKKFPKEAKNYCHQLVIGNKENLDAIHELMRSTGLNEGKLLKNAANHFPNLSELKFFLNSNSSDKCEATTKLFRHLNFSNLKSLSVASSQTNLELTNSKFPNLKSMELFHTGNSTYERSDGALVIDSLKRPSLIIDWKTCHFPNLKRFFLSGWICRRTQIPENIKNNLEYLNFTLTKIKKEPVIFSNYRNLETLELGDLTASYFTKFQNLPKLKILEFCERATVRGIMCRGGDLRFNAIENLPVLEKLFLDFSSFIYSSEFSDQVKIIMIRDLPCLREIVVRGIVITQLQLGRNLPTLKKFVMDPLKKVNKCSVTGFGNYLPSLEVVGIKVRETSEIIRTDFFDHISKLKNLRRINISCYKSKSRTTRILDIRYNLLLEEFIYGITSDLKTNEIQNCPNLETIKLIPGSEFTMIGNFGKLKHICCNMKEKNQTPDDLLNELIKHKEIQLERLEWYFCNPKTKAEFDSKKLESSSKIVHIYGDIEECRILRKSGGDSAPKEKETILRDLGVWASSLFIDGLNGVNEIVFQSENPVKLSIKNCPDLDLDRIEIPEGMTKI